MRAAEWAAWTRTLPWRVAASLGIGVGGGVLGSLLAPRPGVAVGALVAMAAGWGLRFRPSLDAVAWRRGAVGERRPARLLGQLERHEWAILQDLAVPGSPANIDHLAIGPRGGVRDRLQAVSGPDFCPIRPGGCGMAATPSPPPCGPCRSRPPRPPWS